MNDNTFDIYDIIQTVTHSTYNDQGVHHYYTNIPDDA